jgi:ABC-type cobalamin/Fe3+-siderophores transport system ATPase subunit
MSTATVRSDSPQTQPVARGELRLENATVRYGGLTALDSVTIGIEPERIAGVIRPNGSGKSTTINVIAGVTPLDDERVVSEGRDIGSGLEHCPSGDFNANAAWAMLVSIAHNLVRWVGALGLDLKGPLVAKTIRRKFIALPGRITDSGRRRHLHLPTQWPWTTQWRDCFKPLVKLQD